MGEPTAPRPFCQGSGSQRQDPFSMSPFACQCRCASALRPNALRKVWPAVLFETSRPAASTPVSFARWRCCCCRLAVARRARRKKYI
jgi:hypothetical protein